MKRIGLITGLLVLVNISFSQNDIVNQQKYWKFRNSFKHNFIKIGEGDGYSLPMGRRGFGACQNNNYDNPNVTYNIHDKFGTLYWGDGVIRHGHYIGFLATEYKLLKNAGEDVTAVLNELYYALVAFNRLDLNAEKIISNERDNIPQQSENLNGFYLRDDVPENFDDHWKDEPINARGVHSAIYDNNNVAKVDEVDNDPEDDYNAEPQHKFGWGGPSLDQMTSILVGLKVCHLLLEPQLYVKPTATDAVINITNEVQQITNRIISYAFNHNWDLLDMYGVPVENGGGDLLFMNAYPISLIGNQITGNNYSSTFTKRTFQSYKRYARHLRYDDQAEQDAYYNDTLGTFGRGKIDYFYDTYAESWPSGDSRYEQWQNSGTFLPFPFLFPLPLCITLPIDFSSTFWNDANTNYLDVFNDWTDDHKFNTIFPLSSIGYISFNKLNFRDYNNTILMNLGVASGTFNKAQTNTWEDVTHHNQLALIQALLTGNTPVKNQQFYQDLLNTMPSYGPFKFVADDKADHNDPLLAKQITYPHEWGGEYRWTHYSESNDIGEAGRVFAGQFTAMDYMYLHNLYKLIFPANQPKFEEKYTCICESIDNNELVIKTEYQNIQTDNYTPGTRPSNAYIIDSAFNVITGKFQFHYIPLSDYTTIQNQLSQNSGRLTNTQELLDDLESCVPNAFSAIGTTLNTQHNLHQLHDNYADMNIFTNAYQTEMFTIESGGQLDVVGRVIVCENQTLTIESGGKLNLNDGEIRVNNNATLIIEGELNIEEHKKIILEENSKLIIKSGGKLHNKGTIIVNENAKMEYHQNVSLYMDRDYAEINFNGGDLWVMQDATFKIRHSAGDNGFLRFSDSGVHIFGETNSKITLIGDGDTHTILKLDEDADFWVDSNHPISYLTIEKAKVEMAKHSRINATHDLNAKYVHFEGTPSNRGLTTFGKTVILNSTLDDVKIDAYQIYRPNAELIVRYSIFNYSDINPYMDNVISVDGKKYYISYSTINSKVNNVIKSTNLTATSYVKHCDFNTSSNQTPGLYNGISDNSNVELIVSYTSFTNLSSCIIKSDGGMSLKCNTFTNFYFSALFASSNCNIKMSTMFNMGYNKFTLNNSSTWPNIFLDNAQFLQILDGYNTFDGRFNLPIIAGTVQMNISVAGQKNIWNQFNHTYSPPLNRFNIQSNTTNNNVPLYATDPEFATCGQYDNNYSPISINSVSITTPSFQHINIRQAFNTTLKNTELVDSTKNDLLALELFEEIITFKYTSINEASKWTLHNAIELMKQTLQHAISTNKIRITDNQSTFTTPVQRYVNALNIMSLQNIDNTNYQQQFNFEMDKVNLYHTLGKYTLALDIMYNMENCGLDSLEQKHVNHWKYELETEQAKLNYGYSAEFKDTVWTDTLSYIQPIKRGYGNFGSELISPNSIIFYDCSVQRQPIPTTDEVDDIEFSVYPNPSNGILNVTYNLEETSTAKVVIYTAEGKLIYTLNCLQGRQYHNFDLSNVERGIYFYTYIVNGVEEKRGQLIIQE